MSKNEFVLEDGRKAEEIKTVKEDVVIKEIYAEPKPVEAEKKLIKRVVERRPCGYEKEIEIYDENTGEVTRIVEKQDFVTKQEVEQMIKEICQINNSCCQKEVNYIKKSEDLTSAKKMLEEKVVSKKNNYGNYIFIGIIAVQILALLWVLLN